MDRKRRVSCMASIVSLSCAFKLLLLGLCKRQSEAKEWVCWINSKHGSLQLLKCYERHVTVHLATQTGMDPELQITFTVRCPGSNKFSTYLKKKNFQLERKIVQATPSYLFSFLSSRCYRFQHFVDPVCSPATAVCPLVTWISKGVCPLWHVNSVKLHSHNWCIWQMHK
jgi:hypothetical protein